MALSHSSNLVPKTINAVWVGDILDEEGRNNLIDWQTKNPDYEMNLWIDSSTFYKKTDGDVYRLQQENYEEFYEILKLDTPFKEEYKFTWGKSDFTDEEKRELDQRVEIKLQELYTVEIGVQSQTNESQIVNQQPDGTVYTKKHKKKKRTLLFNESDHQTPPINTNTIDYSERKFNFDIFAGQNLTGATFSHSVLANVCFIDTDLTRANFMHVEGITINQFLEAKSIVDIQIDKNTLKNNYFSDADMTALKIKMLKDYKESFQSNDLTTIINSLLNIINNEKHPLKISTTAIFSDHDDTDEYKKVIHDGRKQMIKLLNNHSENLSLETIEKIKKIADIDIFDQLKSTVLNIFNYPSQNNGDELKQTLAHLTLKNSQLGK